MAEPLAIIGAVSPVSQLTGELVTLTTNLRHHLKVMRRAPDEVQSFLMETSNFTCLLNFFTELADRPVQYTEMREQRKREKRVSQIQQQCAYVCDKMEYLVDRFAVLAKGNMKPFDGLRERIRYLLDKPDIKDLRLSLQTAAVTVNCMSTLFAWEEAGMKGDTRTVSLLEQLKNLLPMAKKASTELAEYQRKHGSAYESGVPDPNNAMLAASEDIQRQIGHAIRPYSHPEAAKERFSGYGRRERRRASSVVERTRHSEPWSSPFGPDGLVADSFENIPRRRQNRVSFKTLDNATERHSSDRSTEARDDDDFTPATNSRIAQSLPVKPPSPATNGASYASKQEPGGTSSDKGKQVEVDGAADKSNTAKAHRELHPKPSKEYYQLGILDPVKPRVHSCNNDCTHVYCSLCDSPHCSHGQCPPTKKPESREDKTSPNNNTPRGVCPLSEPQKPGSSARSSHEDTRASPEEQVQYSLPVPTESEESAPSDKEINFLVGHSDFDFPSSKSSSPSARDHGSPAAKRRDSKVVRPAENGFRETQEERKGAPEKQPQTRSQYRVEQEQGRGSDQEGRRRDVLEQRQKEEQRQKPGSAAYGPHGSDDRGAPSREERPAVPESPSRGPSGRRRPRRPRPQTMLL